MARRDGHPADAGQGKHTLRFHIEHAFRRHFAVVFPLLIVAAGIETALILGMLARSRPVIQENMHGELYALLLACYSLLAFMVSQVKFSLPLIGACFIVYDIHNLVGAT